MSEETFFVHMDGVGGYVNVPIWEQERNMSTYYDRKLDTQGVVPGLSYEQTVKEFEEKYQIKL